MAQAAAPYKFTPEKVAFLLGVADFGNFLAAAFDLAFGVGFGFGVVFGGGLSGSSLVTVVVFTVLPWIMCINVFHSEGVIQ